MFNERYLIEPLLERAVASAKLPSLGFVDRAAELMIDRLGVAQAQRDRALKKLKYDYRAVLRCKWIDEQLQAFFSEHPEGTAVELGAGLSTRFHRLSYAEDWPQFSWLAVDSRDAISSASRCFPSVDNYSYFEAESQSTLWLDMLSKAKRAPYFIVIESAELISQPHAFKRLFAQIYRCLGHVHIVVDVNLENVDAFISQIPVELSLRSSLAFCSTQKSFIDRLISLNFFSSPSYSSVTKQNVCHLVLGKEPF